MDTITILCYCKQSIVSQQFPRKHITIIFSAAIIVLASSISSLGPVVCSPEEINKLVSTGCDKSELGICKQKTNYNFTDILGIHTPTLQIINAHAGEKKKKTRTNYSFHLK